MKATKRDREVQALKLDWDEIHRRVDSAGEALKREFMPAPEEKRKILESRAKTIASLAQKKESDEDVVQLLVFFLAYESYGIELSYVRELLQLKELTPLPCTPHFVLGIINVRGEILSIIDIKQLFDLPSKGLTDLNRVIVICNDEVAFGILADTVVGVSTVAREKIQPVFSTLTGIREEYLKGVTEDRLIILDAEKLLSDEKIVVNEE